MRACVSLTFDDDLGRSVRIPAAVQTVVSLVPSLTEAIEAAAPGLVVGATDWCSHPPGMAVIRIGGTKNPRIDDIVALNPDVVIANDEENREPDIAALRDRGQSVWVTAPRTLPAALASLDRMLRLACGLERPAWLDAAADAWAGPHTGLRRRAVVPIWRRPWMVLGADTFAGDVLSRLGIDNVMAGSAERYPKVTLDELRDHQPDLIVLPDEPYTFGWDDGPDAFAADNVPVACVSGRHLTWYGPSLVEARDVLSAQLAAARYSKECSGPG
jgi:ABC-type Fe3+-hydroxamate transport system substrate-binding protein